MNYTLFSVILGMLPGEWWMLKMYEHVRSAELLEPLENYTQNGNCPARFRRGNKKWLKNNTHLFSGFVNCLWCGWNSHQFIGRSDETSACFFQGNVWIFQAFWDLIFIHESLNVPENHHKTSKLKNQWVNSTPHGKLLKLNRAIHNQNIPFLKSLHDFSGWFHTWVLFVDCCHLIRLFPTKHPLHCRNVAYRTEMVDVWDLSPSSFLTISIWNLQNFTKWEAMDPLPPSISLKFWEISIKVPPVFTWLSPWSRQISPSLHQIPFL